MSTSFLPSPAPDTAIQIAIQIRIAALEAELSSLKQQVRNEADARRLRVMAISTRGTVFAVGDLFERTRLDRDLRDAVRGLSSKQLGKFLARCVGREIAGLSVRRVIPTKDGWVWEIHINRDAGIGD